MHENRNNKPLRVAQITDTHLYRQSDGRLLGLDTRACLAAVLEPLRQHGPWDMIVASGDLAHDGSGEAYRELRRQLAALQRPVYCLPGNHDDKVTLARELSGGNFHCAPACLAGGWLQLFLDSTVAGEEGGHLARHELERLEQALAEHDGWPTLVWLHHQPVAVGSRWLDGMAVDNTEAFFDIVARHPQIQAIVWGHVHQTFDQWRDSVRLLAAPSTCLQFLPGSERFAVDRQPPGYRWLELHPGGRLETGIRRIDRIPGEIDLAAAGY